SDPSQRCHKTSQRILAFLDPELVSHRDTHRRGDLRHDADIFVSKGCPYGLHILLNADRACGTYGAALPASHSVRLRQVFIERGRHLHLGTAEREIQDPQSLDLLAGPHTVAAEDTFIRIPDDTF